MFRRRLGKQATLRVDDETFSGRRWLDTLRRWQPEPGAGTVPSPCLTPIRVALALRKRMVGMRRSLLGAFSSR
jgi:hypothetical protein